MIDVDIEEPAISRSAIRSWMSFMVSCAMHLAIFVALSLVVFSANKAGVIVLNAETSLENDEDLFLETPLEMQLDSESIAFEPTEAFETPPTDVPSLEETLDWSSVLSSDVAANFAVPDSLDSELQQVTSGGFFGIEATGNRIVYIIDMSPSMEEGKYQRRFDRAVEEVLRSIDQLKGDQQFFVFLFCFEKREMNLIGEKTFCLPTDENKAALMKWLTTMDLGPGTDPREALVAALQMKPSCCFLLSDGEFNGKRYGTGKYGGGRNAPTAVELAKKHNRSNCPIHTIGLENAGSQKDLTEIAENSKGLYKFIPANE